MNGSINDFFVVLSEYLWGWPLVLLLLGTHLFLTVRLQFPQRYLFKAIKLSVTSDKDSAGDVSQFGSLAIALSATIGTGNIVGVATAVALGGPGSVFWCWLTGVLGMSTKYGEALLGVKYRERKEDGKMAGGPMYVIDKGLGWKWLAVVFSILAIFTSLGVGGSFQASVIASFADNIDYTASQIIGIVVALLVVVVMMGGVKRIAKVCSWVVPLITLFYILGCCLVLAINYEFLIPAIKTICSSAFSTQAVGGGFVGSSFIIAARYGMARGLFSNESGFGTAAIASAAAQTKNSVRQALVASTGTFWDSVVVCGVTGIVIVSCILADPSIAYSDGAGLAQAAFSNIPVIGVPILIAGMCTFAFTTILGWCYYGEQAVEFLKGGIVKYVFRLLFVAFVYIGYTNEIDLFWNVTDCANALMIIPNLLVVLLLSGVIVRETRYYLWEGRLDTDMYTDSNPPAASKK